MTRLVKDFIDISDHVSLDALIEKLVAVRDALPDDCEPELSLRGDEVFGRRLSISFFRPLTDEEAACEARYAGTPRESAEKEPACRPEEIGAVRYMRPGKGKLRAVA